MAERRMFAKTIIDSDAFLDMPLSAQCLYFHLSMRADDEGFLNNHKKIQRMIGASDDDLKILLAKNFIIAFESGVIVIKHWKIHNYIRADRLTKTNYEEERKMLSVKDNGSYTLNTDIPLLEELSSDDKRKKAYQESSLPYSFEYKIKRVFWGKPCPICNKTLSSAYRTTLPTIQHNIPISKGGKHELENISIICQSCNASIRDNETDCLNNAEVIKYWDKIVKAEKQGIKWFDNPKILDDIQLTDTCLSSDGTGKDSIVKDSIGNINYCQKAQEIVDLYHECCPSLPKVMTISPKRISLVKARLKDYKAEQIKEIFIKAESSEFLRNGSGTWKGANFDWILNPNNFIKIMEGNYDNKQNSIKKTGYDLYRETKSSNYDFEALEREIKNK